MKKVIVLKNIDQLKTYAAAWKELLNHMSYPSPFIQFEWVAAVLKNVSSKNTTPFIMVVLEDDAPIGILPLIRRKEKMGHYTISYCGQQYHPDPLGVCCHPSNKAVCIELISEFLSSQKVWDVLSIKYLFEDEAELYLQNEAYLKSEIVEPFMVLDASFDDYLRSFKRKKRYNLNSSVKKFFKNNGSYVAATNAEEQKAALGNLFALHQKRSMERDINSTFQGDDVMQFHHTLINHMDNVWLRSLQMDGQTIAVLYGFVLDKRFFYYQIAHDPDLRKMSPGTVLIYNVIEECYGKGIVEFNFLQGDEDYKWFWTKERRTLYSIESCNSTVKGVCSKIAIRSKEKLKGGYKRLSNSRRIKTKKSGG